MLNSLSDMSYCYLFFKMTKTSMKLVIWQNIVRTKMRVDKAHFMVILIFFLFLMLPELLAVFTSSIFCAAVTITRLLLPLSFIHLVKVRVTWLLMSPFVRAGASLQVCGMI